VIVRPGVAQLAQPAKTGAGGLWVVVERGDGHEAMHGEVAEMGQAVEQVPELGAAGIETGFGGLLAQLDFQQNRQPLIEAAGGVVEAFGEAEGVYRVDAVEDFGSFGGFIGLQVPDEVDGRASDAERGQARSLGFEFLHAIFAEEVEASAYRLSQRLGGVNFGDGHEADGVAISIRAAAGGGDSVFNVGQAVGEGSHETMLSGSGICPAAINSPNAADNPAEMPRIGRSQWWVKSSGRLVRQRQRDRLS
jgi:hypothetical protein